MGKHISIAGLMINFIVYLANSIVIVTEQSDMNKYQNIFIAEQIYCWTSNKFNCTVRTMITYYTDLQLRH